MNDKKENAAELAGQIEKVPADKANDDSLQVCDTKADVPMGLYGWASSWITSMIPFTRSRNNSTVLEVENPIEQYEKVNFFISQRSKH